MKYTILEALKHLVLFATFWLLAWFVFMSINTPDWEEILTNIGKSIMYLAAYGLIIYLIVKPFSLTRE